MTALRFAATTGVGAMLATLPIINAETEAPPSAALVEALDELLSVRESEVALNASIEAARKLGASEQAILESRFLFHVDRQEHDKVAGLLPAMLKQQDGFEIGDSEIFATEEDFLAVIEYAKALKCLSKEDRDGFKKHITEAFWLSPGQGAAFAPHIEKLRTEEAMARVKVDFSLQLPDLEGRPLTLTQAAKNKKAMVIHFFSPWSQECAESMPDLAAVTGALEKHDIGVVNLVGETAPEAIADTRELLLATQTPPAGLWLADHAEKPLSRLLRVQSAPTVVILGVDGKVQFNGHPSDDGFWRTLKMIDPACSRPALGAEGR